MSNEVLEIARTIFRCPSCNAELALITTDDVLTKNEQPVLRTNVQPEDYTVTASAQPVANVDVKPDGIPNVDRSALTYMRKTRDQIVSELHAEQLPPSQFWALLGWVTTRRLYQKYGVFRMEDVLRKLDAPDLQMMLSVAGYDVGMEG